MNNRIEKGDRVRVVFASNGGTIDGTVAYMPQSTGDSWIIVEDDGMAVYIQMFEMMRLLSKPNKKSEGSKKRIPPWKFRNGAEPQGTGEFWYDVSLGGYINPESVLEDDDQIKTIRNAVATLEDFEAALEENGLLKE